MKVKGFLEHLNKEADKTLLYPPPLSLVLGWIVGTYRFVYKDNGAVDVEDDLEVEGAGTWNRD